MNRITYPIVVYLVICLHCSATDAATIIVDLNGTGDYTDVQSALDVALDGDEVVVKPGEYVIIEPINFNRLHDPEDPASPPVKNLILRSEAGANETIIRMSETPTDPDRASVVIFENEEASDSALQGLSLTGGSRRGITFEGATSPIVEDCVVEENSGIFGGGIHCTGGAAPTLRNCRILNNESRDWEKGYGGGIFSWGAASPLLVDCEIRGNFASHGGGLFCWGGSVTLHDCSITGNFAWEFGGVGCETSSGFVSLRGCVIAGNSGGDEPGCSVGGGEDRFIIEGCTIVGNSSCGVRLGANSTVTSTIIWANAGDSVVPLLPDSKPTIVSSCIESDSVYPGDGNISQDPLFCSLGFWAADKWVNGNYRLQTNSPCIGTGQDGDNMGAFGPCQFLQVCQDGTGDFEDIQSAIDAASDGDVVTVCPGEYVIDEPLNFNRLHDPDDDESPLIKNIVLRSEEGAEVTTIRMSDTPDDPELASVVVFENEEDEGSVIEGFVITGGRGGVRNGAVFGGGITCLRASPTVTRCTIVGNFSYFGGGISCVDASAVILNCTISGNHAGYDGGGIRCESSSPRLVDCTISNNSTGAVDKASGGGVFCIDYSAPVMHGCSIFSNRTLHWGGGLGFWFGSKATLTSCTILGNRAVIAGGGVYCTDGCGITITNGTIAENIAGQPLGGGGLGYRSGAVIELYNSIVWGNDGGSIELDTNPTPDDDIQVFFSCIQGDALLSGEGNISEDPLFVQAGHWDDNATPDDDSDDFFVDGDYNLHPNSPCIDSGTSEGAPDTDIEGNPRPCGEGVDMGAYEFQTEDCAVTRFIRGNADAQGTIDITDGIYILNFLFLGGPPPPCMDAADTNDSGALDLSDGVSIFSYLFLGGTQPAEPYPVCGHDLTGDTLTCELFKGCPQP